MIIQSGFKPAWWLKNKHAQTIYSTLLQKAKAPVDKRERLELPDGDFIDLAWAINGIDCHAPLVVLLHGLGGSVHSVYVAGLLRAFNQAGYRAVLMQFRGASHEPNRLPRVYHSGDTTDLNFFLNHLKQQEPSTRKAVVGVSLGGNVLLKWLGEVQGQCPIDAAVAVSVPFELSQVATRMNEGFSRIYQKHLLKKLLNLMREKWDIVNPALVMSKQDLDKIKTIRAFDECVTAPLHGFTNADTYYRQCSSRQFLRLIETPTLIIHAEDDPFMTPEVIPTEMELSDAVTLELSRFGGHVGFITAEGYQPRYWLETRIPAFLSAYLGSSVENASLMY